MAEEGKARQLLKYSWIGVALVLAYSGWVLYSRHSGNQEIVRKQEEKRIEADRQILDKLGAGDLKVLMFYANPVAIKRGKAGLLCYGVSNAKAVRFEPQVDGVGPALSRCVEVKPASETKYTLIASDQKGNEVRESVTVRVE